MIINNDTLSIGFYSDLSSLNFNYSQTNHIEVRFTNDTLYYTTNKQLTRIPLTTDLGVLLGMHINGRGKVFLKPLYIGKIMPE